MEARLGAEVGRPFGRRDDLTHSPSTSSIVPATGPARTESSGESPLRPVKPGVQLPPSGPSRFFRSRTTKKGQKMNPIERHVASITEDRRASYLFSTKIASEAVGCVPNKFEDWWRRTQHKLIALALVNPGQLAAEMASIFALAEVERQRRLP